MVVHAGRESAGEPTLSIPRSPDYTLFGVAPYSIEGGAWVLSEAPLLWELTSSPTRNIRVACIQHVL